MPRKRNNIIGDYPLPAGWEVATDYDGKRFYIDHTTKKTSWIDPRDRLTKPVSFADCVGNQLPYGWDQGYDPLVGIFFVDHIKHTTQLEDPRLQWRETQECMLKDYLAHAHDDLLAKKEIFTVKQERLAIAQEEVNHLQRVNDNLYQHEQWKASKTSLNSTTSISSKYDPDLLKADVEMARKRVGRLRMELDQIHTDMRYTEKGLHTLSAVEQKMSVDQNRYTVEQAHEILNEINDIKKSVCLSEREKHVLLQNLAKLKEEVLMTKTQNGSSPDVSTLSIPQERLSTASQTDLNWEYANTEKRWGEIVRMRLQYDEAKKQVRNLQEQLAKIEEQMVPGQPESDKDRLMLIQEKEQLLRELRSKNHKNVPLENRAELESRKQQLELDLKQAWELSTKQIAERLRLNDTKSEILEKLGEATHLTSYLESELKSLSLSTLSVSSGSSRGSLGSLSASSKGSLNSLSLTDLYTYSQSYPDVNLPELHQWVEKLLQGHTTGSQTAISAGISPIMEVDTPADTLNAPITGLSDNVAMVAGLAAASPQVTRLLGEVPVRGSMSPGSSLSSLSSPPVSPYDIGPPPSYQQHIDKRVVTSTPLSTSEVPHVQHGVHTHTDSLSSSSITGHHLSSHAANTTTTTHPLCPQHFPPSLPLYSSSTSESDSLVDMSLPVCSRRSHLTESDLITNPPLSPISESSSGVCNNTSGVNTRSVSAAVSDESVAGDSGVFEACSKSTSGDLDEVLDMSLESAQVQIKLKYEGLDNQLCVGIEQARNLMALAFPDKCQVCIKVMLLPSTSPMVFTTRCTCEVNNPKFSELCRVSIPENKLTSKTVQIQVWSVRDGKEEECMGGAQVSLAAFDPRKMKMEWYNVLSFKFMQSETGVTKTAVTEQQKQPTETTAGPPQSTSSQTTRDDKMDRVNQLLEMSSVRLRRSSLGDEKSPHQDLTKDTRARSLSFDSSYFRALAQGGGAFTSLKEESSDESTIISSQTSTLTRNQGPDDMLEYPLGHDEDELSDSPEDEEDEDYMGEDAQKTMRLRLYMPENIPEEVEDDLSPDGTIKLATCDKETNTEAKCTLKSPSEKQASDISAAAARNSVVRRSQTFSPMGKVCPPDYICMLNRSDSDSSVRRNKKPFQRNAVERRSVRLKKMHPTLAKSHSLTSFDRLRSVTSIDLELDRLAYQARLSQLNDEITRLKEIKKKFEEAKSKGENEPSWFTDNEQLQLFMAEADKALVSTEGKSACKIEERAARLLKQATREAHRLRRSQKINQPDPLSFRAKMAYLTTMSLKIPAVQASSTSSTPPNQPSPSRHRHTHSDPLVGVSQAELRHVIATRGRGSQTPHSRQVPLSLPQGSTHSHTMSLPLVHTQGASASPHQSLVQNGQIGGKPPTVPLSHSVLQTAPLSHSVLQTVPQYQGMSQTVPQHQGFTPSPLVQPAVTMQHGVQLTVPQTQLLPLNQVLNQTPAPQLQAIPSEKSKLSQLPNPSLTTAHQSLTATGQRRALSFNEGFDRARATNVNAPTREHSFSHTRSNNEYQARVHEAGEHPLAQTRRLQQGAAPLIPATEEQHV